MRTLSALTLAATAAVILAVTLWPAAGEAGFVSAACLLCGERAVADAVSNVVLFVPLGIALAWVFPASHRAWQWGPALSLVVEMAQRFVVGRDASVGDVVTNSLGALLGWMALRHFVATRHHETPPAATLVTWGAYAIAIAVTTWLLGPAATTAEYYGQRTPNLAHLAWYRGHVLDATVGGTALQTRRLDDPAPVRAFVRGSGSLTVRLVAGPPVFRLAPLVSVFDERQDEILLFGLRTDDLVLRYRRRAHALRLDAPDVRFDRAFRSVEPGDTLTVRVDRTARGACLTTSAARACMPGATPGRAWSLLLYPASFRSWVRRVLDGLWLCGLTLPLGWYSRSWRMAIGSGVVATLALTAMAPALGVAPSPARELAGAAAGLALGVLLRRLAGRRPYPATAAVSITRQRSMRS